MSHQFVLTERRGRVGVIPRIFALCAACLAGLPSLTSLLGWADAALLVSRAGPCPPQCLHAA